MFAETLNIFINPQFLFPFIAGIFIVFMGFFILLMDYRNVTYQKYLGLSLSLGVWSMSMAFVFVLAIDIHLILYLALSAAILIPPFFTLTLMNFPSSNDIISKKSRLLIWSGTILILIISFVWPQGFTANVSTIKGYATQIGGPIYNLFLVYFIIYFLIGFVALIKTYRRNIGRIRAQVVSGFIGMFIAAVGAFANNVIPPSLDVRSFYWTGPLFTVVGMIVLAYMIFESRWTWSRLFPIGLLGSILIFSLTGQMIFAENIQLSVFAGATLAGTTLLFVFLIKDIVVESSDRKRLEGLLRKIKKANEDLLKADQIKSEFLTIASHHLRNPLTYTKWSLSELLDETYGSVPAKHKNFIKKLLIRNEESIRFLYSLLDISKIEAGKAKLIQEPINLYDFIQKIIIKMEHLAESNRIKIIVEPFPSSMPIIYIDKETMERIFENIIENAISYNLPGGSIRIQVELNTDTVDISIKDTGIGISKEDLPRIGEKFFRTAESKRYAAEGTGLGIFIAKKIISLHGGKIDIQSIQNKGTTIKITLPIKKKV